MNKLFILLCLLCSALPKLVSAQSGRVVIAVSNPISENRKEELVAIPWNDILTKFPGIDKANFKIVNLLTKKELPWQLEFKGGGKNSESIDSNEYSCEQ